MAKKRPGGRKPSSTWKTKSFNTNLLGQKQRRLDELKKKTLNSKKLRFKKFIASIGEIISGKVERKTIPQKKVYNAFWSAVIKSMFTSIYLAYNRKVKGQADELGNTWADLSPYTKAYKKPIRGRLTRAQQRKFRQDTPGLMTPAQHARWKSDFAKHIGKSLRGEKIPTAKKLRSAEIAAAKFAWYNAKARGAETLLQVLGKQQYDIMHETGILHESLKPGHVRASFTGRLAYKPVKNQVVRLNDGEAEIGTSVEYAKMAEGPAGNYHRPLWPKNMDMWYDIAMDAGRSAIIKQINEISKTWK